MRYITIILVKTNGELEQKMIDFDKDKLFEIADLKKSHDFKKQFTFIFPGERASTITLYGNTVNTEYEMNQYIFPKPMHTTVFYGNCILVENEFRPPSNPINLTIYNWNYRYPHYNDYDDFLISTQQYN